MSTEYTLDQKIERLQRDKAELLSALKAMVEIRIHLPVVPAVYGIDTEKLLYIFAHEVVTIDKILYQAEAAIRLAEKGGFMKPMENIKARQVFRSKKTGNLYRVLLIGRHTEEDEMMAIYKLAEDISGVKKVIWVRPLEQFKQKFEEVI